MKILYIHQYFATPQQGGGTRSYWFARKLIERGHDVTILTTDRSAGAKRKEIRDVDGIGVVYLGVPYSNGMSPLGKVAAFFKFMIRASVFACRQKGLDLVFATSTPLSVGFPALMARWIKKTPYVFEVRDLWPEFPIQIGAIKNKALIWLLRKFEKTIYSNALHVIALSPGMKDGVVSAGISPDKVTMIPNMSKPDIFYPREKSKMASARFNIDTNKFNVIHFGSMGAANGLTYLIDTAYELQIMGVGDVNFIFAGDGATKMPLQKQAEDLGLRNILFLDRMGLDMLSEIVNLCDLSVTSFLNYPVLQTNSPNKFFDSLSAGIPVVVNSAGWTKDIVEKYNCGFYVDPDDPCDFAKKIVACKQDAALLSLWGENSRKLSLEVYDKDKLSDMFADTLERVTTE